VRPCEGGGYLLAVAEVIVERDIAGRFVVESAAARTRRFLRPDHPGSASMSTSTASAASFACTGVGDDERERDHTTKRDFVGRQCRPWGPFMGVPSRC